ncbi:hypothetical protein GB927_012745 [Shinella sp. CPCC 100929]|uniref:Uncharacterized protein n=1 Tax=Shinella lacus TaxID=2654216 RepID=A0ABT1R6U1_9HYPH|nr:hypothetical protein [Shinella lacus]MCQ4630913.1 hypothetical protein [Shinella lacus]
MSNTRLQLRWEATDKPADEFGYRDWVCKYELSIALNEYDIRREDENYAKVRDSIVIEIGSTKRGSSQEPCIGPGGAHYFDPPYRDASHATWDAAKLGNLPIVCIAIDGTIIPKPTPSTTEHFNPANGSQATADQMAAVMLQHGTTEQREDALDYATNTGGAGRV